MGTVSKVVSVVFRFIELVCAVIVAALIGRYLNYVHDAHADSGSRVIYAIVLAGISILAALVLFVPWMGSFLAFPLDIILFIMWIVAFGLLVNLVGTGGCHSSWYWTHWGYYWGGFWHTVPVANSSQALVNGYACSRWSAVLAFSFIGAMFWLFSACLGGYNSLRRRNEASRSKYGAQNIPETSQPVGAPRGNFANGGTHANGATYPAEGTTTGGNYTTGGTYTAGGTTTGGTYANGGTYTTGGGNTTGGTYANGGHAEAAREEIRNPGNV